MHVIVKASRDQWMPSMSGHTLDFKKGKVYQIPDYLLTEAIQAGAVPLDLESSDDGVAPPTREDTIQNAVQDIIALNNKFMLTAEGYPRVNSVSKITGFVVTTDEILVAFRAINAVSDAASAEAR